MQIYPPQKTPDSSKSTSLTTPPWSAKSPTTHNTDTTNSTDTDNTTPISPITPALTSANSYQSVYTHAPVTTYPYSPSVALSDIAGVSYALELFLSSKMLESEAYLEEQDQKMERLYVATGYGLIQCVKGLMSYEDADLLAGIMHTKQGNYIASSHRKKAAFLGSRLAGYVVSSVSSALHAGSVQWIKSMTDVERHAELVYAESLFEKALLGIVYSGDWLAFIKEALNMRTTISVYRQLMAYIEHMDALYAASHSTSNSASTTSSFSTASSASNSTPASASLSSLSSSASGESKATTNGNTSIKPNEDPAIDAHFRSGVLLGVGMSNIILSLMPGKLMALVELFGYKGDRKYGLECLMHAGGWMEGDAEGDDEPQVSVENEGVRRSICDMALLIFHLVLSSFTFEGVDIGVAGKILKWNLKRYPNGVFFLFGAGRLALMRSNPAQAIAYYRQAMDVQKQYRNLHHISFWEIAIAHFALWEVEGSLGCWRELEKEATWSKAIYSYGMAVCLLEISWMKAGEGKETEKVNVEEASRLMEKVPGLRQKIAGKSIPLEKFVARKARKFLSQKRRLMLPALEMAYIFQGIAHAPRKVILQKMLPEVARALRELGWVDCSMEGSVDDNPLEVKGGGHGGEAGLRESKDRKDIEKSYGSRKGGGYWDDFCLAMFLRGVCMRYVAYPDPDAELEAADEVLSPGPGSLNRSLAEREAEASFKALFEHGPKIELDHQLVYHAHYELGRLLACQAKSSLAKAEFELVLSGKPLEVGPSGKKGKYSMENALHMRTHAAVDALEGKGKGGRL